MPSLNLDLNFFDHPKVKRLRARLGQEAEIYLIRLWAYTGKFHSNDGILKGYIGPEIEGLAEWKGKPGVLLEAMLKVGFIEKLGQNYRIHDWIDHEGHLAVYKARAMIANAARWKKSSLTKNASSNACKDLRSPPSDQISTLQSSTIHTSAPDKPAVVDMGKSPVNWENCKTDHQRFMAYYVKSEFPTLYVSATQAQASDKFKRYGKAAREILTAAGDLETAKSLFDKAKAFFIKQGLSWNLSTVAKNCDEFANEVLRGNNEPEKRK